MIEPQIPKEFGDAMTTHQVQMIEHERPSDLIITGMSLAHILE